MTNKCTPGVWYADIGKTETFNGYPITPIAVDSPEGQRIVAVVMGPENVEEPFFNAHAVAATKELLEACKEALTMIPSGFLECNGDKCRLQHCRSCYGDEAVEYDTMKIRAAIAKAEPKLPDAL